jgi:Uncharacterized protein conserved in bacteria (DUF2314)
MGRRNWGERMWVKVVAINKRHIVGMLDNDPIGIPRLYRGDQLKFKHHHIIDIIWEPDDSCDCQYEPEDPCPIMSGVLTRGATAPSGRRRRFQNCPRRHTRSLDAVA